MTCDSIRNNAQKSLPVNQEFSQNFKSVEQGAILRAIICVISITFKNPYSFKSYINPNNQNVKTQCLQSQY